MSSQTMFCIYWAVISWLLVDVWFRHKRMKQLKSEVFDFVQRATNEQDIAIDWKQLPAWFDSLLKQMGKWMAIESEYKQLLSMAEKQGPDKEGVASHKSMIIVPYPEVASLGEDAILRKPVYLNEARIGSQEYRYQGTIQDAVRFWIGQGIDRASLIARLTLGNGSLRQCRWDHRQQVWTTWENTRG